MTNSKNTKKALFSSVIALILCCSMLIGTTFAWFTDEVNSGVNQIIAGNLDVDVLTADGNSIEGVQTLFNAEDGKPIKWEPGVVAYENLTVVNKGDLALKYQLSVNFDNENTVNGYGLSTALKVAVVEGGFYGSREEAMNLNGTSLASFVLPGDLQQSEEHIYGIVIWWDPSDADNNWNVNNGKTTSDGAEYLHIDLGIKLVATQLASESDSFDEYYDGAAVWYGDIDLSWYDPEAEELTIGSAEQLAGLAAIVNGTAVAPVTTYAADGAATIQDSFANKTIKLVSDINLNNLPWTPVGNWENTFDGTFDGQGHTIYNLYINDAAGEGIGLFGVVQKATIKGINIHNVNITGYSMVAGVVGAAYPANISDCHITGDVNIVADWAYVAGFAGYCYYGTQVDGCSVVAEGTGLIQSVTRNAVGGITAWLLEGDHKVTNCHVENLNLVGWTNVGGITGFVHYSNTISGCTVENVKLTKTRQDGNPGIGLIAGGWSYHANNAITLSNNTVKNATLEGTHIAYSAYDVLYGSEYNGATTANFTLENNTTENITNNLVVVQAIKDAGALKTALATGGEYALSADITLTETVTVPANVNVTLYMNGKTIAGTLSGTGNQDLFLVKGGLTMKDGAVNLTVTQNQGWNAMSTIFDITAGGAVSLDHVVAENKGGTDMNFVAHLNNWGEVTLNVENSTLKATYCAVRVNNSGYDMNNVTIKNSTIYSEGNRAFWVHNYIGDLDSSKHSDEAINARLNFDIFGNGNTYVAETNTNGGVIRYGFSNTVYYTAEGLLVATSVEKLNELIATAAEGTAIQLAPGTYEGVELKGTIAKNLTIVGTEGAVVKGIHGVKGSSQLKVVGLTLKNIDFQDKGLYFDNDGTPWNYVENLTMTGCTFVGTGTADTSVGNRLFDVGGDSAHSNQYFDIVIENCTVSNANQGIRLGGVAGDGNKVVGNTITNVGHNAITVRSTAASGAVLLVEGNTISNGGDRAFRIGTNSGIITYKNNVITNCGDPEDGSNFKAKTLGTVIFEGNTVDGVAWNPLA